MFAQPPDEAELAKIGMVFADLGDSIVEVWPDNVQAHNVMAAMSNQWRLSPMGGPYALDYAALPAIWPVVGIADADRMQAFKDLQVMESAALKEIQSHKK